MSSASIIYRACVPCLGSSGIDREPVSKLTCARLRWRELSDITPGLNMTRTPPAILSVAPLSSGCGNWIATVPPLGGVNWRTAREIWVCVLSIAVRAFSRGQRLITNSRGGFKALRSLLLRNPLIPLRQEPTSGRFHRLVFPPVPLLSAAHDEQHAARSIVNGQTSVGEFRNVVR